MRYHLLKYLVVSDFALNFMLCTAIGISSKLDFDDSKTSSKLIQTVNKFNPNIVYKRIINDNDKNSKEASHLTVTCASAGCNTTESDGKSTSKDSIQTDVVVHVKTNVSVNNNSKTNFEEDTPDIPIIVGSADPKRSHNQFLVRPSIETIIDDGIVSITPSPVSSSSVTSLNRLRPSLVPSTVHSSKTYHQNLYFPSNDNLPKISIGSLLSEKEGRSAVENSANAVEVHIPHFEATYHNHYFGENPPPQVVWFPKTTLPEYKSRTNVKPTLWSLEDFIPTTQKYPGHETTCTCKKHVETGLQWYPTKRAYGINPGSQINDKLGRLD